MRSRRLIVAAAVLGSLVMAQPAFARHMPLAFVEGRVTDQDGAGLGAICVAAHGDGPNHDYGWTRTREDGRYRVRDLPPSHYRIHFWDCDLSRYLTEWYDDRPDYESADVVVVGPDGRSGVDASLALAGSIAGSIVDDLGAPASGVCVAAYSADQSWVTSGWSDDAGSYVVPGLRSGDYRLRFGCDDVIVVPAPANPRPALTLVPGPSVEYVPEWYRDKDSFDAADPVTVELGRTTEGIDAALMRAGRISGRVLDPEGEPAQGICVSAESGGRSAFAWTGHEGRYTLGGISPGNAIVWFSDCNDSRFATEYYDDKPSAEEADPVVVAPGADAGGIDAVLNLRPAPDLTVLDLSVTSVPLRTDQAELVPTGLDRRVHVEVGNIGDRRVTYAVLEVWATTRSDLRRQEIALESFDLGAGGTLSKSFAWNGAGSVGDVTVHARVCHVLDRDNTNNRASLEHYVLAGGTGAGFRPGLYWWWSSPGYCEPDIIVEPFPGPV